MAHIMTGRVNACSRIEIMALISVLLLRDMPFFEPEVLQNVCKFEARVSIKVMSMEYRLALTESTLICLVMTEIPIFKITGKLSENAFI